MTNKTNKSKSSSPIPIASARNVTAPKRARARKNPVASPAPVADPIMQMVEDYRSTQNEIKVLNDKFALLKDALTRHLVAGDEDSIELPDGSYVVTKVMKPQWTYSEELKVKRIKLKEQELDLKNEEKKERLNGTASATKNAHVMGRPK